MHNLKHKSIEHLFISFGAITVGVAAVFYGKIFSYCENIFFKFYEHFPFLICLTIPLFFLIACSLVHYLAPEASGSGIPAVLEAVEQVSQSTDHKIKNENLVSLKTSVVKIISSCLGVLGGMSLGMEGPIVQIASSIYSFTSLKLKKILPQTNRQIYLIAGAAAGIAAAFNTPIGGVAFALEELIEGHYTSFKQAILVSIILSGFTAVALEGNYLYFEINIHDSSILNLIFETLLIAVIAGLLGGFFAKIVSLPIKEKLPGSWWIKALYLGCIFSLLIYMTGGMVSGAGITILKNQIEKSPGEISLLFPLWKMIGTAISYFSGMSGGLFAPSLSIGASVGLSLAKICHFTNLKTCALLGMVAFFSASVQAPMTAFIVVAEMTNEHRLILPFMLCALIGQILGKFIMPIPLYRHLLNQKYN